MPLFNYLVPKRKRPVMMADGGTPSVMPTTQTGPFPQVPVGGVVGETMNPVNTVIGGAQSSAQGTAIGGMFGLNGGINGTGFAAPSSPTSLFGVTNQDQIDNAYQGSQTSLNSQQALLAALQGQQGLSNQNQVYNQLQGVASGVGPNPAQAQYYANIQNQAAQQAGAISSQKGISPALANREIAQQGGAAMQNAAAQGAANTAAQQLGAIQQSGAMANTMASNQIGQTNANAGSQLAEQGNILNAAGQANMGAIGMQGNINNVNGMLAGQQMGAQQSLFGGALTGGGSLVGAARGGMVRKMADGGDTDFDSPDTTVEDPSTPDISNSPPPAASGKVGGKLGGGGGSGSSAGAIAGLIALMADGGTPSNPPAPAFAPPVNYSQSIAPLAPTPPPAATGDDSMPVSRFGNFLRQQTVGQPSAPNMQNLMPQNGQASLYQGSSNLFKGIVKYLKSSKASPSKPGQPGYVKAAGSDFISPESQDAADQLSAANYLDDRARGSDIEPAGGVDAEIAGMGDYAEGGKVQALVSPGELWLPPTKAKLVAKGKNALKIGERIPGTPKVPGNSYANDVVPKKLDVGGVVIPNSIMQSSDPASGAHAFVAKIMAKRRAKK